MSTALPLQEVALFFGLAFQLYANSLLKMKCYFTKEQIYEPVTLGPIAVNTLFL